MKAVWSFWSVPFRMHSSWKSKLHHLFSWVVSVEIARKYYPRTALYTDDEGARMLVDGLGLAFDQVSTCLNSLVGHDPDWWAFGKVVTYSLQEEPFVHLDSDVYLWSPLPERLASADVLAQNPEEFGATALYYRSDLVRLALCSVGGWVPTELSAYIPRARVPRAACCGIVGGHRVDFLRYYAGQAIRLIEHPSNRPAWDSWPNKSTLNMLFEQHLLVACLDYHSGRAESPYAGTQIEYLFSDFGDAYRRASTVGFTHLLGHVAKQDPQILARLENRVRTDYPAYYERCMRYWRDSGSDNNT